MKYFLILIFGLMIFITMSSVHSVTWIINSTADAGIVNITGSSGNKNTLSSVFNTTPTAFHLIQLNGTWGGTNTVLGYSWNTTQWVSNSSVKNGIPSLGTDSPTIATFTDSGNTFFLFTNNSATYVYLWNGSQWVRNTTYEAGISTQTVEKYWAGWNYNGNTFLLEGTDYGIQKLYGWKWNGSKWLGNSTVNCTSSAYTDEAQPTVWYNPMISTWWLITGNASAGANGYTGYQWNSTCWVKNATINSGLTLGVSYEAPLFFTPNELVNDTYLIVGEGYVGTTEQTYGFSLDKNAYAPNVPTLNSPINGSVGNPTNTILRATCNDNDSAILTYKFYSSTNTLLCTNASITNNTLVNCTWSGLTAGTNYGWYVNCSDTGLTTKSAVNNFTINRISTLVAFNTTPTAPTDNDDLNFNITCIDSDVGQTLTGYVSIYNGSTLYWSNSTNITNNTNTLIITLPNSITSVNETWKGQYSCGDGLTNVSSVNVTCYQESLDTSNQTGIDGNTSLFVNNGDCGLQYNGNYTLWVNDSSAWATPTLFNDGNWTSYATSGINKDSFITENVTYPNVLLNTLVKTIWSIKTEYDTTIMNATIPADCLSQPILQLKYFFINMVSRNTTCWNGTHYKPLNNSNAYGVNFVFEDSINWTIATNTNSSVNISYAPPPADTCIYTSGNWALNCNDNCTFSTTQTIDGNITISGNGIMNFLNNSIWKFNSTNQYVSINKGCTINIFKGGGWNT